MQLQGHTLPLQQNLQTSFQFILNNVNKYFSGFLFLAFYCIFSPHILRLFKKRKNKKLNGLNGCQWILSPQIQAFSFLHVHFSYLYNSNQQLQFRKDTSKFSFSPVASSLKLKLLHQNITSDSNIFLHFHKHMSCINNFSVSRVGASFPLTLK